MAELRLGKACHVLFDIENGPALEALWEPAQEWPPDHPEVLSCWLMTELECVVLPAPNLCEDTHPH